MLICPPKKRKKEGIKEGEEKKKQRKERQKERKGKGKIEAFLQVPNLLRVYIRQSKEKMSKGPCKSSVLMKGSTTLITHLRASHSLYKQDGHVVIDSITNAVRSSGLQEKILFTYQCLNFNCW